MIKTLEKRCTMNGGEKGKVVKCASDGVCYRKEFRISGEKFFDFECYVEHKYDPDDDDFKFDIECKLYKYMQYMYIR